jgi:hypothetical protein
VERGDGIRTDQLGLDPVGRDLQGEQLGGDLDVCGWVKGFHRGKVHVPSLSPLDRTPAAACIE